MTLLIARDDIQVAESLLAPAERTIRSSGFQRVLLDATTVTDGMDRVRLAAADGMLARVAMLIVATTQNQSVSAPATGAPTIEREYVRAGPELDFVDIFAPAFITFFAYFFVFILTSVVFLPERGQGERPSASWSHRCGGTRSSWGIWSG